MAKQSVETPRRRVPGWVWRLTVPGFVLLGRLLVWVACRVRYATALRLGRWFTDRFEPLTRRRRHRNMQLFFANRPQTPEQQAALDRDHQAYLARMRTEVARSIRPQSSELCRVVIEGEDHLRSALARQRGVLVVSGHTATWWNVPAILARRGYRVTAIFTEIAFPSVRRQLLRLTDHHGVRVAFVGRDAAAAIRHAAGHNEILYLTYDVAVNQAHARWVPLGGAGVEVDPGPAILALRHRMAVVQAACVHRPERGNTERFYPPDELPPTTLSEGVDHLCRLWVRRLEQELSDHPDQWWAWGYVELQQRTAPGPAPAARRLA